MTSGKEPLRPHEGRPEGGTDTDFNALVSEAADHARERSRAMAAPDEAPLGKSRVPLLVFLGIVLAGVVAWNVWFFEFAGIPAPETERTALQGSVFLAQQAVEVYREENGALPPSLDEVGADEEGLVYTPSGESYSITATGEHGSVVFRRGDPLEPYRAAFQFLLNGEVTP